MALVSIGVPPVPGFSLWHGDGSRSPAFPFGSEPKQEMEELLSKPQTWLTLQRPAQLMSPQAASDLG